MTAYELGFMDKCAQMGVNPSALRPLAPTNTSTKTTNLTNTNAPNAQAQARARAKAQHDAKMRRDWMAIESRNERGPGKPAGWRQFFKNIKNQITK